MNIWIINHYAIPPTQNGGTRHFNIAKKLIENGHKVTIFAADFNHFSLDYIEESKHNAYKISEIEQVQFLWIPTPAYNANGFKRLFNVLTFANRVLKKKYRRNLDKPDIIIGSSPHPFAALSALKMAKQYNVPYVFELRDLWPDSLIDLKKFSSTNPFITYLRMVEKKLINNSRMIVSLLPNVKNYLLKKNYNEENIFFFPNFIDLQTLPRLNHVRTQAECCFMYVGNHGLANSLDTVVMAAKILEEKGYAGKFLIKLIGDGPEKNRLIELAKSFNLSTISFVEKVSKKEIYSHIAQADVCIMPLKKMAAFESGVSPNKLFDYMGMAKPIIYSVESANNIVADANAGVTIKVEDPADMAKAMIEFIDMPLDARIALGNNARVYLEKNYDLNNTIHNFVNKLDVIVTTKVKNHE
jgi:glycosyltransferase involved in cell wall biosynthesis